VNPGLFALTAKEFGDTTRSRWLGGFILAFCALGLGLSLVGNWTSSLGGGGFGRTTAALINLILLIVPLMSLTAGSLALSSERERRTLEFLLSLPLRRSDVFWAKFLGCGAALLFALGAAFATLGAVLVLRGGLRDLAVYAGCFLATVLLSAVCLALGLLASSRSRRAAQGVGLALIVWLCLVFAGDLGLLGAAVAVRLRPGFLLAAAWLNPLSLYRLLAIDAMASDLDVLGPAGLCARDSLGAWLRPAALAGLLTWLLGALAAARLAFLRSPSGGRP
jgi:Cu-processing system permease protein